MIIKAQIENVGGLDYIKTVKIADNGDETTDYHLPLDGTIIQNLEGDYKKIKLMEGIYKWGKSQQPPCQQAVYKEYEVNKLKKWGRKELRLK